MGSGPANRITTFPPNAPKQAVSRFQQFFVCDLLTIHLDPKEKQQSDIGERQWELSERIIYYINRRSGTHSKHSKP